jgi:hypothetical protein
MNNNFKFWPKKKEKKKLIIFPFMPHARIFLGFRFSSVSKKFVCFSARIFHRL